MSRLFLSCAAILAVIGTHAIAPTTRADSAKDAGLKQGDSVGIFYVTKVAGADDDGVEPGEDLCYRCRYGSRPIVLVFARNTDGKVPELVKAMDSAVAADQEGDLRGLLTLIGDDVTQLKAKAGEIAKQASVKHVPLAVAKETQNGPMNYKLSPEVAVTIVLAKDSQVVSTHAFAADAVDVPAVMKRVKQMLN